MPKAKVVDYGPLAGLIGTWTGDKGLDVAPEPDGIAESPYYETIVFDEGGDVDNADSQVLAIVPYTQIVTRKSNDEVFHHQVGYWLWDAREGVVIQTLTIPRAVSVVAGAQWTAPAGDGPIEIVVAAQRGGADWGIVESPFMRDNASTVSFEHRVTIQGGILRYTETTVLEIYGKTFDHTDGNQLTRQ